MEKRLESDGRGVRLRRVAGGYALAAVPGGLRTPPGACWPSPARRRSPRPRPRLLAIVRLLQPVSRPEVAGIRGVHRTPPWGA